MDDSIQFDSMRDILKKHDNELLQFPTVLKTNQKKKLTLKKKLPIGEPRRQKLDTFHRKFAEIDEPLKFSLL